MNASKSQSLPVATRFSLTLDHVYIFTALALLMLRPLLTPAPPHDLWWHIATGRLMVEQGAIPTVDAFSYTQAGMAFFNQGWLAQLLMYGLHQAGGVELLLFAQALVIGLAYGLLLRLCIIRSGRVRLSVALLLLTTLPLSFDNWTIRPQSYVFPLFAAYLTILTEYRMGRNNRLWLLPLLMVLWANLHGTFVLGLALIALTFVGELLKRLRRSAQADSQFSILNSQFLLWSGLTGVAVLLNPRGPAILSYVRTLLSSNSVTSLVTEWAPPTIRDTGGLIFFLFVIGLAAVLIYSPRRPDLTDMLMCGAFLWLALGATRSIVWFGFVATPVLVLHAASLMGNRPLSVSRGKPRINALLIGMLGLMLIIALPWLKPAIIPPPTGRLLSSDTPVAAVEVLRDLPQRPQRLFHAMGYGSYLIWAAPEQKVFIDPRIELYPYQQWADYIALGQGRDRVATMERYGFDGLLLDKQEQKALIDAVRADPSWKLRYEDDQTALFTR